MTKEKGRHSKRRGGGGFILTGSLHPAFQPACLCENRGNPPKNLKSGLPVDGGVPFRVVIVKLGAVQFQFCGLKLVTGFEIFVSGPVFF